MLGRGLSVVGPAADGGARLLQGAAEGREEEALAAESSKQAGQSGARFRNLEMDPR